MSQWLESKHPLKDLWKTTKQNSPIAIIGYLNLGTVPKLFGTVRRNFDWLRTFTFASRIKELRERVFVVTFVHAAVGRHLTVVEEDRCLDVRCTRRVTEKHLPLPSTIARGSNHQSNQQEADICGYRNCHYRGCLENKKGKYANLDIRIKESKWITLPRLL